MQLPFLMADPDISIAESRDANTDEGLYTNQIRNYINQGDATFNNSDCLVKTPLLSAVFYGSFRLFGTSHLVARLTILILSLSICLYVFRFNSYYASLGLIAFLVLFSEYYVFHYFHFCIAEILSTVLIFLALFIWAESSFKMPKIQSSFLSATFISCAYFVKFQYVYAIIVLPLAGFAFWFIEKGKRKQIVNQLWYTVLFLVLYLMLYILVWYLPHKTFLNFILADQSTGKFAGISHALGTVCFNGFHVFLNSYLLFVTIVFGLLFFIGIRYLRKSKSSRFVYLFISFSVWLLVEFHKLPMVYLPTRYLISLFFPMGILISLVLLEIIQNADRNKITFLKLLAFLIIALFVIKNSFDYTKSLQRRTFSRQIIDNYIAHYQLHNRAILGTWAASLSWENKALCIPVYKTLNDKNIFKTFNPAIIITEVDEEESNQAYSSQNIVIDSYADSIKHFTVNRWHLKLLWIKDSITDRH